MVNEVLVVFNAGSTSLKFPICAVEAGATLSLLRVGRIDSMQDLKLDKPANASGWPHISTADSGVSVWVIPTDEELMIAQHTLALISPSGARSSRIAVTAKAHAEPRNEMVRKRC